MPPLTPEPRLKCSSYRTRATDGDMPEFPTTAEPVAYQLRVVLRGVSPLIWRRLLVRNDSTIADMHASLQLVFGWSDEHLNRFVIHGREYGVWHDGGVGFGDNTRHVPGQTWHARRRALPVRVRLH